MGRFSKIFGKKPEPVPDEVPINRRVPPINLRTNNPYIPPPPLSFPPAPPSIQELPPSRTDLRYIHVEHPRPPIPDPTPASSVHSPRASSHTYAPPRAGPASKVSPGDLPLYRAPGQRVKPEELRELREQIRQRYQLDVQLWGMRYLRERDRDIVEKEIKSADALLDKIRRTVISWDKAEFWDPHTRDYEKFREVKRRVCCAGKRDWSNHPPWEDQSFGSY